MFSWLPATIFGFALLPFVLFVSLFVVCWMYIAFEPRWTYQDNDYYEYKEYSGSGFWALVGTILLVWFVYTVAGEFSLSGLGKVLSIVLFHALWWIPLGAIWAMIRWRFIEVVQANNAYDHNLAIIAKDHYNGDVSKVSASEKWELSEKLPNAEKYWWSFLRWTLLWPVSFLDAFLRDLLKNLWKAFYTKFVVGFLNILARRGYGDRYMSSKPEDYKNPSERNSERFKTGVDEALKSSKGPIRF